jgi:hypothetical protein
MANTSVDIKEETGPAIEPSPGRDGAIGLVSGIVIGAAAGLVGVGGGECRTPDQPDRRSKR